MLSFAPKVERARPLLGTTVSIRVEGLSEDHAHRAIDLAFDEIALVHRLMSFQEWGSDISRLNREASDCTQDVHPATFEVLYWAREIAGASDGAFDITVAGKLAAHGFLPYPDSPHGLDPYTDWRDIELGEDYTVRFRKPLWIDVSGIAKGYAVDRAIEALKRHGVVQASVNAGGDLRVYGTQAERIRLRADLHEGDALPVLEIANAAVASSSAAARAPQMSLHLDARTGTSVPSDRFASVVAESCLVADALTKPVLIMQEQSLALLQRYRADAHLHDPANGWRHLSGAA